MIDYSLYNLNQDDLEFLKDIEDALENQNEVVLQYKDLSFVIEPGGKTCVVISFEKTLGKFADFDDLLLHFLLDGSPMIEKISEIEYGN
ncbi:MAG: hypothetical protein J6Z04_01040 [Clostridia bacterium]|nr:hypothetical protein [Clostridia bacterium]